MFVWSKLLSAVTQPMTWVAIGLALAWLVSFRRPAMGRWLLLSVIGVLGVLGFQAIPDAMIRHLENQYPQPESHQLTGHAGLLVLGGATEHPWVYKTRGQVPLGDAAERMTAPLVLLRQHPDWVMVYSGGESSLKPLGVTEAEMARVFFTEQDIAPDRVVWEAQARTTRENAQQVARLLGEQCHSQRWVLLTSAWHMPRSMAEFQSVGCTVTPYPVDFRTGGHTPWYEYSLAKSLLKWQTALHEYAGMLAYAHSRPVRWTKNPPQ